MFNMQCILNTFIERSWTIHILYLDPFNILFSPLPPVSPIPKSLLHEVCVPVSYHLICFGP